MVHTDFNCLSVLQYAVEVLKVKHIIVCGHYGCGGVKAAMQNQELGLIDNWLRNIKDVYFKYGEQLEAIEDEHERFDYLCELNVAEQVANVCHTTIIQNAWRKGQELAVHGWIYGIRMACCTISISASAALTRSRTSIAPGRTCVRPTVVAEDQPVAPALYLQIKQHILDGIRERHYQAGDRIPTEAALCEQFAVSRMTVNKALRELVAEGWLVRTAGSGSFVADRRTESPLLAIRNIADGSPSGAASTARG